MNTSLYWDGKAKVETCLFMNVPFRDIILFNSVNSVPSSILWYEKLSQSEGYQEFEIFSDWLVKIHLQNIVPTGYLMLTWNTTKTYNHFKFYFYGLINKSNEVSVKELLVSRLSNKWKRLSMFTVRYLLHNQVVIIICYSQYHIMSKMSTQSATLSNSYMCLGEPNFDIYKTELTYI